MLGPLRLIVFTAVLTLFVSVSPARGQTDPRGIIVRIDRLLRGDSSRAVATMEVVTEHWERQMTMEMWSLGTDYTLVRLRAPAKEAGTATLMARRQHLELPVEGRSDHQDSIVDDGWGVDGVALHE